MLHPLREAAPDVDFIAANEAASCRYMKMITLPKLRDALREMAPRGEGAGGDRRARAAADRAHGRDRLARDELPTPRRTSRPRVTRAERRARRRRRLVGARACAVRRPLSRRVETRDVALSRRRRSTSSSTPSSSNGVASSNASASSSSTRRDSLLVRRAASWCRSSPACVGSAMRDCGRWTPWSRRRGVARRRRARRSSPSASLRSSRFVGGGLVAASAVAVARRPGSAWCRASAVRAAAASAASAPAAPVRP